MPILTVQDIFYVQLILLLGLRLLVLVEKKKPVCSRTVFYIAVRATKWYHKMVQSHKPEYTIHYLQK
jgi:hypothetical protein